MLNCPRLSLLVTMGLAAKLQNWWIGARWRRHQGNQLPAPLRAHPLPQALDRIVRNSL